MCHTITLIDRQYKKFLTILSLALSEEVQEWKYKAKYS